MLVLEQINTPGIAQLSYLIGDSGAGTAAVIDPRPDCGVYLELAERHGLSITHAIETHIHADFLSGSRALKSRLGGEITVCVSGEEDPDYGYDVRRLRDGDRLTFGDVTLTARHTPGHTPEHLAYEVADGDDVDNPWGVFSGDSLFVGSLGRPDLLGEEETEELARKLFRTMRDYYRNLDDGVLVYPGHGAGSACGADIGDRPVTTIGREKRENEALDIDDEDAFLKFIKEGAPPVPAHYPRLKKVNLQPHDLARGPACPPLSVKAFRQRSEDGDVQLLDTRDMLAFGGGHVPGAINIGDRDELSVWAGDMLDPDRPLLLIAYDDGLIPELVTLIYRVGFTRFAGYLAGGMTAWNNSGLPLAKVRELTVKELNERRGDVQPLDVRSDGEWGSGRVPGATHFYVGEMRDGSLPDLDKDRPVACYCGSGYRASIAASLLKRGGFAEVINVPGSWGAWKKQDLPVEGGE
ncbi:MBL fold metallo-hydrolase [Alienimonas californiensis]|uniref:Putative metallo-hydrolase n=1 Tax=Alienimonas californiensis TaxID=2527989 RepID=A0A517PBA8_9PLAN|nr:MBL fold metallo-hydrolase [Alienimonas californiensis]QDT16665.1 putative metallo-hydrolase [Alienimonas californiensis]